MPASEPPPRVVPRRRSGRLARWRGGVRGGSRAAVAVAVERLPQRVHRGREMSELLEVLLAERFQLARAPVGQVQAYHALVVRVGAACYQSGGLGAIDESDGAVVAQ
jgi:hypothetical protein